MSLNNNERKKVNAMMILEVIGKPPEHLTETLNKLVEQIGEEKGVVVKNTKINTPVLMKTKQDPSKKTPAEQQEFYTSFAEVEVEVEEISHFAMLMFKYMPAHVEIISPETISMSNNSLNEVFNELTRRLHGYDEIARVIQMEKSILEKKLREILGEEKKEI